MELNRVIMIQIFINQYIKNKIFALSVVVTMVTATLFIQNNLRTLYSYSILNYLPNFFAGIGFTFIYFLFSKKYHVLYCFLFSFSILFVHELQRTLGTKAKPFDFIDLIFSLIGITSAILFIKYYFTDKNK